MSLANKYRPQTFDEMIGQEHIIDILKAQMKSRDEVHHNYLLFGPRGTGKTTSARLIAKGLNCLDLQDGNPCNHCSNCELINNGTSLDYVEIDAASHTSVDDIREEIIEKSLYPPTALRKKIYVIDEVHMLSKSAFNALLKTIEEPKGNVCFILATTEIHKVPDTIISRCQVFNYRKVSNGAMIAHLENICKSEGLQYVQSALEIITNLSEGCVRDAVKYVDQVSILGDLNEENVSRFLGVAGEALLKEVLTDIKSNDRGAVFSKLDEIANQGIDLSQFAKQMLGYIDQHLLEDTDFYLVCSEIFGNVISTLKWYPYPLIAYKIAINNYFMGNEGESAFVKNGEKKELKIEKAIEKNVASAGNLTTSISENGANENVGGGGSINEESRVEGVAAIGQEKDENGDGDKIEAVGSGEGNGVEGKESIENQGGDFSSLWARVISQMNKPTVQANLKDQAIIEKKEGNVIEITVITAIARMLLENPENKKLLEQLLSKELGENVEMCVSFIKKEEYFSRKMGL